MTPAEELLAAADKLDGLIAKASPGPWYYNGYSYIGSGPKSQPYNEWAPGDEHTLERSGKCEACGEWREKAACHNWPRGHGCRYSDQDYDMDPQVAGVPSHHGDTAIREPQANAEFIELMDPLVGKALALALRRDGLRRSRNAGLGLQELLDLARLINGGTS